MVVPWQVGLVFVGFTGLPHPDVLHSWAARLMPALHQINLPEYQGFSSIDDNQTPQLNCDDACKANVQTAQNILIGILVTIVTLIVGNIVAVCLYKSKVHDAKPPLGEGLTTMANGEFHYKLFDCFSNINECMCSCFCSTVRYADTHSSTSGSG